MLYVLLQLSNKDKKIKLITRKAFSISLTHCVHVQGINLFWLLLILAINELLLFM